MFDSQQPHGLQTINLLCSWDFPGENTGVGCHFLPQGTFLTQVSNPRLLQWQAGPLPLCHLGGPKLLTTFLQMNQHFSVHTFKKHIYLFGCARSQLRHESSLVAAFRIFTWGLRTVKLQPVGSSSLSRDRTRAPCPGSTESQPLDPQGSPISMHSV